MPRYGRDYGQRGGYTRGQGGGYDTDFGGLSGGYDRYMRGGAGGFGYSGQPGYGGYSAGFGYSGGYGTGYADRETSYGGAWYDSDMGRGGMGMGPSESSIGERGGRQGNRMRASEIMTENPEAVTPDATLADVARRMREMDVGIIPVVEDMSGRRLRGVITDRDIAVRAVADGKDGRTKVSECMTPDVETVNKNDSVHQVLQLMQREQVRRVPVTDREGRLVGIIAQADLTLDYAEDMPNRERMVEDTIERISEPGNAWRGARW
jgi:CBS domain-containing protein